MQTSFTEPPNSPFAICVCVHYKTPVPALGIFGLTLCQTIDAFDNCATCCHMALVFDIVHIFVYTVKKKKKKFYCTFIHNLFDCFCPFCFCNFLKNGLTLSLPAVHAKYICLETSSAEACCSSEPAMRECCLADHYLPTLNCCDFSTTIDAFDKCAVSVHPYLSIHHFKDN